MELTKENLCREIMVISNRAGEPWGTGFFVFRKERELAKRICWFSRQNPDVHSQL